MYVCICNALTQSMVARAIESGAAGPDHVHAHFDCAEKCGTCRPDMEDMIDDARTVSCPRASALSRALLTPQPAGA